MRKPLILLAAGFFVLGGILRTDLGKALNARDDPASLGEAKGNAQRFLKIAKWKLVVNWQASGSYEDSLKIDEITQSAKSMVKVNGHGEFLIVKRPDDTEYGWSTSEGIVSVSYEGKKPYTIQGAGRTVRC